MHCPNLANCEVSRQKTYLPSSIKICPGCGHVFQKQGSIRHRTIAFVAIAIMGIASIAVHRYRRNPQPTYSGSGLARLSSDPTVLEGPRPLRLLPSQAPNPKLSEAEEIAASVPPVLGLTPISLANALARKGEPGEITDHQLLSAATYCWLGKHIAYDVISLNPTSRAPQDPSQVLVSRVAVCEGYACLTEFILNHLGIETRVIHGLARTSDQPIGHQLNKNDNGHAWNLVKWDGDWHILDVTWGAGPLNNGRFEAKFTWEWFDAPPSIAIYSHLPDAPADQRLPSSVTQEEMQEAAHLRPLFFRAIDAAPLPLISGTLTPGASPLAWRTNPGYQLLAHTQDSDSKSTANPIDARVIPTADGSTEIHFPNLSPGEYDLHLFAGRSGQTSFSHCGEFLLRLDAIATSPVPPKIFPKYQSSEIRLITPIAGTLTAGQWQNFALQAQSGFSLALQYDDETTLSHFSFHEGKYVTRLRLREGILHLVLVEDRKIWTLAEFEVFAHGTK